MKKIIPIASIATFLLYLSPHLTMAVPPEGKGYVLLYAEEFDADTLNTDDWVYRLGSRTGMGYINGLNRKENVYVKDGRLHIIASQEVIDGKTENAGGGIISRHDFGYGYYECLSRPFMGGAGVHTAFWQRGSVRHPNNTVFEIDSYEIDSKVPMGSNNLLVDIRPKGQNILWPHRANIPVTLDGDGWFLDAYEFTPDGVIYYDNGEVVAIAEWNELTAAQSVWLTALNGTGPVDAKVQPGESIFEYFRYYAKDYPGVNILPNGNFEYNKDRVDPSAPMCWSAEGTPGAVAVLAGNAARDDYRLHIGSDRKFSAEVTQELQFIMNGLYNLTAMVRTSASIGRATIRVSESGGSKVHADIKPCGEWTKIPIGPVEVVNNSAAISIMVEGSAGEWLEIDDIEFMKPLPPGQAKRERKPFTDHDAPLWFIAVGEPIIFRGDEKFYFFDRTMGYGDVMTLNLTVNAAETANMTPIARIAGRGEPGWAVQLRDDNSFVFRIGTGAEHYDVRAENMYTPGCPVVVSCVFDNGVVSIYADGRLVKKETVPIAAITDKTTAGRMGTVGKAYEAMGEVLMKTGEHDVETREMRNFRGTLQKVEIYNRLLVR